LDFTPDDLGTRPFPTHIVVPPYQDGGTLHWRTGDWDPALRFWDLPFDPQLTEWLQSVNPSLPSISAAREFAARHGSWREKAAVGQWLEQEDLEWRPADAGDSQDRARANAFVLGEIEVLKMLMQDDRERYLAECDVQADGLADYAIHFIGADRFRHPWTIELISCALAIGNVAYMHWKSVFKRVRPSFLCPGLIPPFGPPGHPAFPSGHSLLGHLIALFLLEIPALQHRFGVFAEKNQEGQRERYELGRPVRRFTLKGTEPVESPLLWLAQRIGKNRERIGVHFPSDTHGSRHLASGLWWALMRSDDEAGAIECQTLRMVLSRARSEWHTPFRSKPGSSDPEVG
jgi:membrane-associated phospholipid phosphatase